MDIKQAITGRISTRAYLDKTVSRESIRKILDIARWSPSGVNTQPWQVAVVQGDMLQQLSEAFLHLAAEGVKPNPDYDYYPGEWIDPYKQRRFQCGMDLYQALEIGREDKDRRIEAALNNYRFFGAPVSLFFFMDRRLGQGSWLDMGMFIQSVMLAAREYGLGSCPQASTADYPNVVREKLQVSDQNLLLCGLALGYPDEQHPVNQYRTERESVDTFCTWFD
ncbi:MAG TPA: nitroreductase [Thiolapillus brandeum]|uniref:Nitroreductase n=1 Tax=Thiolapillus brandeum TaxID=1076588 RepID=A0A831KD01_9GAMM|nr:nitroreductase [Thiolapillus brandeum]